MSGFDLLSTLRTEAHVFAAELRPPRAELATGEGMDAWIDTYHAVRRLTREQRFVFLTDSAVGAQEEDNLRHLVTNLGRDVPRERVVPFLTTKHSVEYCLSYADRAHQNGFSALVILGGDKDVGAPRCVEHAWELRRLLRDHDHTLALGGWANPYRDPQRQVDYLGDGSYADFYLTQIVSHHTMAPVAAFLRAADQRGLTLPGVFGVFFFRSASRKTLETLQHFLPVPIDALIEEFGRGASPEDVCARTIRALMDAGARHFYISNLPLNRAPSVLSSVLDRVGASGVSA